jgi:nucleoside 2-deoxyribosyltransferase
MALKVYLAGPEVFFADASALIERKRALTGQYGFVPNIWLGEGEWPKDKYEVGLHISAANEAVMRDSDFVIANMTPFRGLSTDVGTAYEIGFMCALGRPAFGYSNDGRHYDERATAEYYRGAVALADDGMLRAHDGQMVEDHAMADNLMLDGGITAQGGEVVRPNGSERLPPDDLSMFEQCLAAARRYFDASAASMAASS